MNSSVDMMLHRLRENENLTKQEYTYLIEYLQQEHGDDRQALFSLANEVRHQFYDDRVYMRGLIEFSNYCKQDCMYCGIRHSNKEVERYRLTPDQILACCEDGYGLGYRTFVLQSGEDDWFTSERMANLIRTIKVRYPDVAVTLSVGERTKETYQAWFDAGADRYLMRHETASSALYAKLHPTMHFASRQRCLHDLKEIGYQVGAGFMVGLPEQTAEDLAEDLMFLKELMPHMIGIGPFIPHHNTPLYDKAGGTIDDTLVMIALSRLVVPRALIPATTAMGSLHKRGRELALKAGANVVMPNLSPTEVRPNYALYENKICTGDESAHCRACIEVRIGFAGFRVDMQRGDHVGLQNETEPIIYWQQGNNHGQSCELCEENLKFI